MKTTKICPKCKLELSIEAFYKQARGLSWWCKQCCKDYSKSQTKTGYFNHRRQKLTTIQHIAYDAWKNTRRRSIRTGRPFELTKEWIEQAFERFCSTHYHDLTSGNPFRPSLDRINNSLSYTPENVQVTWVIENIAKNSFTEEQLVEFCKRKLGLCV